MRKRVDGGGATGRKGGSIVLVKLTGVPVMKILAGSPEQLGGPMLVS